MILIILAMIAPIVAAFLIGPIVALKDRWHISMILCVLLIAAISWVSITAGGHEGAAYRFYVSIVSLVAAIMYGTGLFIGKDSKAVRIRTWIGVLFLLVVSAAEFFWYGVFCG